MVAVQQVTSVRTSAERQIPGTLDAVGAAGPDWRESFTWPAPFSGLPESLNAAISAYLEFTSGMDVEARRTVLLARPTMILLAILQAAKLAADAERAGARMTGHPFYAVLHGEGGCGGIKLDTIAKPAPPIRLREIRRLVRTATWSPGTRLVRATLRPDGVSIQHNPLMRDWLRRSSAAVRNAYESDFRLGDLQSSANPTDPDWLKATTADLAHAVVASAGLPDAIAGCVTVQIRKVLEAALEKAADTLGRLRNAPRLPKLLVTGTGSKYFSRALGLEVMRRGGEVVRCDHGGSFVLLADSDNVALNELAVSSKLVVATPAAARSASFTAAQNKVGSFNVCSVEGAEGDPGLDVGSFALSRTPRSPGQSRRVMYVSTVFYGMHQVNPPVMPAPLYLDWQIRLLETMRTLPISVIRKPHPGALQPSPGLFPGDLGDIARAPFEQAIGNADILLYDYAATTTLALGLCTDRPIVLLDHGTMKFDTAVAALIGARCRIVRVTYDERNLPVVDRAELTDALCDGPDQADPTAFRELFLGDYA